jgi:hypothetical protein
MGKKQASHRRSRRIAWRLLQAGVQSFLTKKRKNPQKKGSINIAKYIL